MSWKDYAKELDNYDNDTFNIVGMLLSKRHPGRYEKIFLDDFVIDGQSYSYIVIIFKGGGMSVRNAYGNSLNANFRELFKIIDGGYYKEVDDYKEITFKDGKHYKGEYYEN